MVRAGHIREPLSNQTVADAAAALTGTGCPVCRQVTRASNKFFTWFAIENYGEVPTLARLRAAAGMCPAHTRRLLAEPGAFSRLTTVYGYVLPAVPALLAAPRPVLAGCPACENRAATTRYTLRILTTGLRDPHVARAYAESDGLCLVHLAAALPVDADRGRLLTGVALDRLAAGRSDLIDAVAAWDEDGPARAALRAMLPAEEGGGAQWDRRETTVARICTRLDIDACPSCLTAGQAERRYLRWLCTGHTAAGPDALRNQPGGVCTRHLHDLALLDPGTARWALTLTATRWAAVLAKVRHRLDEVPPPWLRGRLRHARTARRAGDGTEPRPRLLAELLPSRRARTATAYAVLRSEECMVCRAVDQQTQGDRTLLLAALDLPAVATRYADSHGLCLHHVLHLPPDDPRARLPRQIASVRAALLAAELGEASRKRAWLVRHEPDGPESSAWLRAPGFLHGEVFLGGPAHLW